MFGEVPILMEVWETIICFVLLYNRACIYLNRDKDSDGVDPHPDQNFNKKPDPDS